MCYNLNFTWATRGFVNHNGNCSSVQFQVDPKNYCMVLSSRCTANTISVDSCRRYGMLKRRPYRAQHLVQWNARQSIDVSKPLVDKKVEAVLYQQGIPFEHTSEYRNLYSYDKLQEQLEHYDRSYFVRKEDPYLRAGLKSAFRIFACPDVKMRLEPVKLNGTAAALMVTLDIKGDRSAGLTAFGETKLEAMTVGLDKAISILCGGKAPAPCLAGVRTQRKGKTRLVWMFPLEMTIIEAVIARPLINYFLNIQHVMTFGDFSHETGTRMRRSAAECKYHYSIDYSQFDSTIGPLFIHYAFNAFRTWFNLSDEVMENVTVGDVFDRIESYFITCPIVMPSRGKKYPDLVVGKKGGVPSGSYFTQLVDSFVNTALIYSVNARFDLGLSDRHVYVLGDDCLFFCNRAGGDQLLQQISQFLGNYGFKVNAAKGSHGLATDRVEYLGRSWRNGFPMRKMSEIVRGSLYPEKFRKYSPSRAKSQKQVLAVLNSYLLTSYLEDPPVGVETFSSVYHSTPWMSSGYTEFLLRSGMIPGDRMSRAVY